ncbi:helix-turn-helix domain-containing protein [Nocardia sp. NPDC049220]|uniref:TetR/AcrR family transcriptional regulator n=1 Tax=Nocardia sp. NPDC049220 TaxID=3155273 RepID=UPI0033F97C5A
MAESRANSRIRPKQRRAKETRDRILESATQLFADRGVDDTSTNRIAAHAGMSIGSLYRYFADKDEILAELRSRLLAELEEQFTAAVLTGLSLDPGESFAVSLRGIVHALIEHRALVRALAARAALDGLGFGELERRLLVLTRAYLSHLLGPLPDDELDVKAYVMVGVGLASSVRIGLDAPANLDRQRLVDETAAMVGNWLRSAS